MSEPAQPPNPSADRIGQVISGRYRIVALIGEGGMGSVYEAEHTHMRKRLALKLLHPQMAKIEEVIARFRREAEAASHIEHPNIVAATDFGETEDGSFFLVLEYVDGPTLRMKLADGPMRVARALHIGRQIALALEKAHEGGVVHRDLKPENVMLVTKGEDPDFVKVLDFGVARMDSPKDGQLLTQAGMVMGTPSYMSPEQAVGDRVTAQADLYALGCVMYEMLTGKVPFEGDLMELLTKHVTMPVPRMAERAPDVSVPAEVEALVLALLAKEAVDRPAGARAVVEAIDRLTGQGAPTSERRIAVAPVAPAPLAQAAPAPAPVAAMPTPAARAKQVLELAAARADELVTYVARRLQLPKAAVLGGAAALALLVLVVALVAVRRSPEKGGEGTVAKLLAGREAATPDEVRAAAAKGPAALEELAAKYPKDPAIAREIAFAYDAAGRSADALRIVRQMLEADPKGLPRDVVRVVIRAASKMESADEAFRLLEGPLGADGVDALMELAENVEVPASTASRAQKSLAKPQVRANASPASAFVLDLGTASSCDAKHDLLVRSGTQADARSLPALRALETKNGCGRRRRFDCNPCLRKDDALTKAIQAAQASSAK